MAIPEKPICVVIDANRWRSPLLLKSVIGEALLNAIREKQGYVGLPEIIEHEIIKLLTKTGTEAVSGIKKHFDTLNTLKGAGYSYTVPSKEEIEALVRARLGELETILKRIAFKWEHAQGALKRIMEETPPNGPQNQQFKDSAIWEAILELSRTYTVHWVTNDMAFFDDRKPENGLARNLLNDCKTAKTEIVPYNDLAPCLEALTRKVVDLDFDIIGKEINRLIIEDLRKEAYRENLVLEDSPQGDARAFPTTNKDMLAISYQMEYPITDITGGPYTPATGGTMNVTGSATYNIVKEAVENARVETIEMAWVDAQGRLRKPRSTMVHLASGTPRGVERGIIS